MRLTIIIFLIHSVLNVFAQSNFPDKKTIEGKIISKLETLGSQISIIGDKATLPKKARESIDAAIDNFIDSERTVEVSYITSDAKTIKRGLREYFTKLMNLNYNDVTVTWTNPSIVNVKQDSLGRYVCVATIVQYFRASNKIEVDDPEIGLTIYQNGYSDQVTKLIEVYMQERTIQNNGETLKFWEVLLGDIKVLHTKKL
ncbi:MAG: hypothetical protein A2046_00475 [Bacteroidetes bacterium GWA2_30_7]|nr:MAG: hypothetical protein A2046_00475 [Bacteroidetes bacterium GWA2_30_7]